jgi:L-malate glycosyltransferase
MPLRILVLNCVPDLPEAESYCELQRSGHHVTLVTDPRDERLDLYLKSGVSIVIHKNPYRFHFGSWVLLRSLLKQEYDVVFAPTSKWLSVALLQFGSGRIPVVTYRGTSGNLSYFDPANLLTHLSPRVSRIVCVSDSVRGYLKRFAIPQNKLVRIYKGHNPSWYARSSELSRGDLEVPSAAKLLVCVANVRPLKGIDVLLRALALCHDSGRCKDTYCLIVGDCPADDMPRLAKQLGLENTVRFLGYRKDAAAISGLADLAVMPSIEREGFPRAVLEAMFQGVPVVVSDVGGLPEMIEHGVSGYISPAGDPGALSDEICAHFSLSLSEREHRGLAAMHRAQELFSHEHYVDQLEQVFCQVAKNPKFHDSWWLRCKELLSATWLTLARFGTRSTDARVESSRQY